MNRVKMSGMLFGLITIMLIILLTSLIISMLLRFTNMTEASFSILTLIVSFLALFIGGLISGAKAKEHGLIIGASTGLIYALIVFFIQYLGFDHGFSSRQDLFFVLYIAVSSLGGMFGVNLSGGIREA